MSYYKMSKEEFVSRAIRDIAKKKAEREAELKNSKSGFGEDYSVDLYSSNNERNELKKYDSFLKEMDKLIESSTDLNKKELETMTKTSKEDSLVKETKTTSKKSKTKRNTAKANKKVETNKETVNTSKKCTLKEKVNQKDIIKNQPSEIKEINYVNCKTKDGYDQIAWAL